MSGCELGSELGSESEKLHGNKNKGDQSLMAAYGRK